MRVLRRLAEEMDRQGGFDGVDRQVGWISRVNPGGLGCREGETRGEQRCMNVAQSATVGWEGRWEKEGTNLTVKPGCWRPKSVPCTYSL